MFDKNVPAKQEDSTQGGANGRQRKLRPSVAIALALMGVGAVFLRPRDPSDSKRIAPAPPVTPTPAPIPSTKPPHATPATPPLPEPTRVEPPPAATEGEPKAYPSRVSLKAERASASTNARSQVLAARLTLRNVSGKTLQAFIGTEPGANDDAGNAYTSTSLSGPDVKGISVCWSGSRCLADDKAKTESAATTIPPDSLVVLNIAFCCKISGTALPSKASADVQIQVRESSDGESFGAWRSVSVGWPEFAVTAGK